MIPPFLLRADDKKVRDGNWHCTGLDWLQRILYGWILINMSCYGMLCELPELGLDEIGLHWDCIGIGCDTIRYDTTRHDTVHVCINIYE